MRNNCRVWNVTQSFFSASLSGPALSSPAFSAPSRRHHDRPAGRPAWPGCEVVTADRRRSVGIRTTTKRRRQQRYGRSDRTRRNHRRIWMTDAISHTPSTFALCLCGVVSTDSSTPAQKGQHVPAVYYLGVYTRMKIFPTFDLRYYWPAYQHIV